MLELSSRGRAFTGAGGEERAYRAGLALRAMLYGHEPSAVKCRELGISMRNPRTVARAQAEGVNSAGGVLVPTEIEQEILSLRDLAGVFRANARSLTIGSDVRHWPRRTGGLSAGFLGENSALAESTATFDNITFSAKKIGALVRASSEVMEGEEASLAQWFVEELAFAFADEEDECGFAGDGTSAFGGIRGLTTLAVDGNHNAGKYTAATGHNTFGTLDAVDLAGFMGLLPNYAASNAQLYMSQTAFSNTLFRLAQSSGALTSSIGADKKTFWSYLGFPVRLTPQLPSITTTLTGKAMMFLGDLRLAAAIATRRGVTVRRLAERFADNDQVGFMGTERFDLVVHDMGDNANAGPLVSLVAP